MKNTVTRICIDSTYLLIVRSDESQRSYPITTANCYRAFRMIVAQKEADRGVLRYTPWKYLTFFSRMPVEYRPGRVWHFEYLTLRILPSLRLEIDLTEAGKAEIADLEKRGKGYWHISGELLKEVLGNGFSLDPDDDGRCFLTLAGIDDDGQLDVKPGDLGWFHNRHAIEFWYKEPMPLKFDAYYFGDTNLDQQGVL